MTRTRESDEIEIRNGVFDILLFVSSGKATSDQFSMIADKIKEVVFIFDKEKKVEPLTE